MAILRAEDGTPLQAKEGVLVDEGGRPLAPHAFEFNQSPRFKVISLNSWSSIGLALLGMAVFIPILITAGFALAAIVAVFFTLTVIHRKLGHFFRVNR